MCSISRSTISSRRRSAFGPAWAAKGGRSTAGAYAASRVDPAETEAPDTDSDGETAVKDKIADMLDARAWAVAAARFTAELARSAEIEGVLVDPDSLGVN